jgi:hypothetical protein
MKKFLAIIALASFVLAGTSCTKENVSPNKKVSNELASGDRGLATDQMSPP